MKLKKVLACLMAGTMVMSMATVMTAGAASDEDNKLTVWTWDPNFNIYAINKAAEIYAKLRRLSRMILRQRLRMQYRLVI